MKLEGKKEVAKYVAEFTGTYFLIFAIGSNVIAGNATFGVLSIACTLTVMIYALANVSGANFNPAVTLALVATGRLEAHVALGYIVVQVLAGVCAAWSYMLLWGKHVYFSPNFSIGYTWYQAMTVEVLYTFMLCFVVLNTACVLKPKGGQYYGLAIGFVIVAGGGCFNPAVSFGIDAVYYYGIGWGVAYVGFELVGAALAAVVFRLVRPEAFGAVPRTKVLGVPPPALISELVGTFMLVATICLNIMVKSPAGALSISAALMCMIYSLGDVSGAHFNPAVTLAIMASGRHLCSIKRGALYIFFQVLGALLAVGLVMSLHDFRSMSLGPTWQDVDWTSVIFVEILFTMILCYVVLCVATVKEALTQYFGLAIGFCVLVGGYSVGQFSGGTMNPAATIALWSSGVGTDTGTAMRVCILFVMLECIGALLAAGLFFVTWHKEYTQEVYA